MSLIITRNFNRAKAQDAVERNATSDELNVGNKIWITQYGRNYPYTITKKWKEGWTVWYRAKNDKSGKEEIVAGAFANALDAAAQDAKFKVGDRVWVPAKQKRGVIRGVSATGNQYDVEFMGGGGAYVNEKEIEFLQALGNSRATDYDPNPQTRGKDIEAFSAQATREESVCENMLRKVIADVEELVIKIHGPMSSWEEVIENSKMSPELPEAKKWSGTANRRYDYLLARERAISSILSELKRNHID